MSGLPYATEQRVLAAIGRGFRCAARELLRQYIALCAAVGFIVIPLVLLFGPGVLFS